MATGTGKAFNEAESSPPLELSGYGTFTGPGASDTINSVTLTVNQFSAATAIGPPRYELWDGTTAVIGSAAGTASTSSAHTDTAVFTGVTYAQLATLRVRITGYQGAALSGSVLNVNWAGLTVSYTPASGTTAVLASGTGAAGSPVAAIGANAVLAAGEPGGGQPDAAAAAGVNAVPATGAGAALNASPPTPAGLASGTGTARSPVAAAGVNATVAAGTGTAQSTAFPQAGLASGTGAAQNATASTTSRGPGPPSWPPAPARTRHRRRRSPLTPGWLPVPGPPRPPPSRPPARLGAGSAQNAVAAAGRAGLAAGSGMALSSAFPGPAWLAARGPRMPRMPHPALPPAWLPEPVPRCPRRPAGWPRSGAGSA